ncbi:MAG: beta-galactosidase, partial [Bryobacteraceae bacterium]
MKRSAALLMALFAAPARPAADAVPAPFVQAVQFQYDLCPPNLWERELVQLKNIGIETVQFSVSTQWHQIAAGDFDFTGRTNPRRDLARFVRLVRRVGLQAWVETEAGPPQALAAILAPQTLNHGGPIAWTAPPLSGVDAATPPSPVHRIVATDPAALAQSREALATARGALLWTAAIDAL